MSQNYPNPFNPETIISYQLPVTGDVTLKVYDALGKEIATLIHEKQQAGKHSVHWSGTDSSGKKLASGIYYYQLTTQYGMQTKKAIYLK